MRASVRHEVWKTSKLAAVFLGGVRAAIPMAKEQIEVLLALLATRRSPVRRFLDLGCGDGILGATILRAYPRARGVFADFSPPMLEACRTRVADAGPRAAVRAADFSTPAWTDAVRDRAPFDAVVSGFAIHHQPDARKRALYAEIFDVLAPGGWFVHLEHVAPLCPTTRRLFRESFVESIARRREAAGQPADRGLIRRRFVTRPDHKANLLAPIDRQCAWLRRIGFDEVDVYFKIHELAVFGGRRAYSRSHSTRRASMRRRKTSMIRR